MLPLWAVSQERGLIFRGIIMSLRPACAGTQTGTPQRMKTPPTLGGKQHTPRIGPGGYFQMKSHATGIGMEFVDDD